MKEQIESFINSQVVKTSKGNVFTFDNKSFEFVVLEELNKTLPIEAVCCIEGSLESGDDELDIKYSLLTYNRELSIVQYMIAKI